MARRTILSSVGAVAALLALLVWAFAPRPVPVETARVAAGPFEQSIEEDGRTRLKDRYTVSTPVAARLQRIALREGDRVGAGDTVAILIPLMSAMVDERSAREATARHHAARAAVQRANARMERAQIALDEAQLELHRTDKLVREGFLSESRLDTARFARAAAQHEQEAARAEREMAAHELAVAAAALLPVNPVLAGRPLAVQAPVDGAVLHVAQPSESTLAAGAALMEIGDPARMEIVAELLTTDAVQAQPGSRAIIERWGGPAVEGRVRRVEPAAFTKVSALGIEEQRVKVLIDIESPPQAWAVMGDGFRVTVRVVTQSIDRGVLVPIGAVFPFSDGGTAVYLVDGGRARLQPVELGGRNGSEAWVRTGVREGQRVILYPPPAITDGKRVQIRPG
jgi:HlyD family secretion protein